MKLTTKNPMYLGQRSKKDFLQLPQGSLPRHYDSLVLFPIRKFSSWAKFVLVGCIDGVPIRIHLCTKVFWSLSEVQIDCLQKSQALHFRRNPEHFEDSGKNFRITRFGDGIRIELSFSYDLCGL